MLGSEAERVSELLDITPVCARNILVIKERYSTEAKVTIELNPDVGIDRRIIDAMRWKDNGQGRMGYCSRIVPPPLVRM